MRRLAIWFKIKCQIANLYCWLTHATPVLIESKYMNPNVVYIKVARPYYNGMLYVYFWKTSSVDITDFGYFSIILNQDGSILLPSPSLSSHTLELFTKYKWNYLNKSKRTEQILKYN